MSGIGRDGTLGFRVGDYDRNGGRVDIDGAGLGFGWLGLGGVFRFWGEFWGTFWGLGERV